MAMPESAIAPTLGELLERSAFLRDRIFLESARDSRRLAYGDLPAACERWTQQLDRWQAGPDARVMLRIADPMTAAVALVGVLAAGRVAVPVDPGAPPGEIRRISHAARAEILVTDQADAGPGWHRIDREPGFGADVRSAVRAGGAIALATSGSTGAPKLVQLDIGRLLHVASAVARHNELSGSDRGYNALPLFHINAEVVAVLATLVAGSTLILDERFHRSGFFELLAERQVTWVNAVPAIWSILASTGQSPALPRLRFVRSASAPLPAAVRQWLNDQLGVALVESYGMTEAASQITATPLDGSAPAGSVGRAVAAEIEIRRGADPAPPGTAGRVWVRGPGVISSYALTPGLPANRLSDRFDAEGWLDTGDLGHLDDGGHLFLRGRADDVINRGGEMVHPQEIEDVLRQDLRIRDAVVVGRRQPMLGAVPVAYLQLQPGQDREREQVLDAAARRCDQQLSAYKRPAELILAAELPRAANGKVQRRQVGAA